MASPTVLRVQWEIFPNEVIREMHVDIRLFKYYGHTFGADFDPNDSEIERRGITSKQLELLESLHEVHGVYEVGVDRYTVRITKGEVFAWDEIIPRVEQIVLEWLGMKSIDRGETLDRFPKRIGISDDYD